jgi:hypothetical protein
MLVRSVAANNDTGLYASSPAATIRIANSTVTHNQAGWITVNRGVMQSYGDNYIDGNYGNQDAPLSIARK